MSEANGKDPEGTKESKEEVKLSPRLAAIRAFLESLTDEEKKQIRSFRPLVKDYAGDLVRVELTDPKRPFKDNKDVLEHLSIKALPMVEYNEIWRKKMANR